MKNVEERRNRTIAREANHHATMRAPHIDKTAISPYDDYCDGYGMPGAYGNGYVSVLKVSAGTVEKTNDELVDRIVTYDKAEAADAYVGQINMLTASSFCGMAGQVWGYDLARHDSVDNGKSKPLFTEKQWNGRELEVYDAAPLLSAGVELFGTEQNRRYHPIPGAHTICANKGVVAYRPKTDRPLKEGEGYGVWSFIAISLSADRDFAADLFIEDAGVWTENDNEEDMIAFLERVRPRPERAVRPHLRGLRSPHDEAGRDRQRHHGGSLRHAGPQRRARYRIRLAQQPAPVRLAQANGLRAAHGHRVTDGIPLIEPSRQPPGGSITFRQGLETWQTKPLPVPADHRPRTARKKLA